MLLPIQSNVSLNSVKFFYPFRSYKFSQMFPPIQPKVFFPIQSNISPNAVKFSLISVKCFPQFIQMFSPFQIRNILSNIPTNSVKCFFHFSQFFSNSVKYSSKYSQMFSPIRIRGQSCRKNRYENVSNIGV